MSARPIFQEHAAEAAVPPSPPLPPLAASHAEGGGIDVALFPPALSGRRRLTVHAPMAAFDLIDELDFLSRRAIEGNVFFAPQFLVPAMPRLDEREVRLMAMRDEGAGRSRLRLLMPFSVERPGLFGGGAPTLRAWSHPFGRLGTPLLDGDDPDDTVAALLDALARPVLGFPDILVLPDLRLDGPATDVIRRAATARGLAVETVNAFDRAALLRGDKGVGALRLSPKRRRELARQRRILEAEGPVRFMAASEPGAVRLAFEEFLILEAGGWKGRERSALMSDRFRSAFAREAVNRMAETGRARLFSLRVGDNLAASLVTFALGGEAVLWKIAYDERFARASPGLQLVAWASERLMADPVLRRVDSCAMPDSLLVNRLWGGRVSVGTLVVGLTAGAAGKVPAVARALETARRSRNGWRLMRERLRGLLHR